MNRHIILATISLNNMAGGLENNFVRLTNYLVSKKYEVSVISFDLSDSESFFEIDRSVLWHKVGLSKPHGKVSFFQRLGLIVSIYKILKQKCRSGKTTLVCFHHGILLRFLLASFLLPISIICSERNSLSLYKFIKKSKWNLNFLMLFLVQKITVQFPSYIKDYPFFMRNKIVVISNPVYLVENELRHSFQRVQGRYQLLTVGRLCAQKNQGLLISAFSALAGRFPDWDLVIVGEGSSRNELTKLIDSYDVLSGRIIMTGAVQNVGELYSSSHVFCLPSQWEGFPNVLAEALSYGLPSVGFSGCAGVRDLIIDGENGFLVEGSDDVQALTSSLEELMGSPEKRVIMSEYAKQSVKAYSPDKVFESWEALLEGV